MKEEKTTKKKEFKKDRLFTIILGLVLVNLVFFFTGAMVSFLANVSTGEVISEVLWSSFWVLADGIAIVGVLYMLRINRRMRRLEKEQKALQEREENETRDGNGREETYFSS